MDFMTYMSGVFNSSKCDTVLNHNVLAVGWGYDSTTGLDYWLIKNAWSTTWGEKGYIRIQIVD